MNTRKSTELEIIQELTEDAKVLVENGDGLKRVPANVLGKVKTVNGKEPDGNGNIEIEGVKNFNDLESKPFYTEETEVTETIMELQTVNVGFMTTIGDEVRFYRDLSELMEVEEGKKYTITVNGVEYNCEGKFSENLGFCYLGNLKFFNGEDTGEPFIITSVEGEFGGLVKCAIVFEEQANEKELGIVATGLKEVVKPLDKKFLPEHTHSWNDIPDSMKPLVINGILTATDGTPTLTVQEMVLYNDVKKALLSGRRVVLVVDDRPEGCTQILPANSIYDSFIDFNNMFAGYAVQLKNNDTWGMT